MTREEVKQRTRDYIEHVTAARSTGSTSSLVQTTSTTTSWASVVMCYGVEGKRHFIQTLQNAFPDLYFRIEDLVAEKSKVVIWWTLRGTHRGEFINIPPTNNEVEVPGMEILRIADGKYREQWTVVDLLGLMRQLGAVPKLHAMGK